jgi:hypothetical protein
MLKTSWQLSAQEKRELLLFFGEDLKQKIFRNA